MIWLFFKWILWTLLLHFCSADSEETPHIVVSNATVLVGHEAVLSCTIENLGSHRVGWIKGDSKAIIAIHTHVISHDKRFNITFKGQGWNLHIDDVRKSDTGSYICSINTDPMMSRAAYLEVVDNNKPVDTNTTKQDETNDEKEKKEKSPDNDSSTGYCLAPNTPLSLSFIFVFALIYNVLS